MSKVRGLAGAISAFVVRHASSGSQEWAEALAREVEEVPGDWAALAWSLGGLRVLVDRREVPVSSITELTVAAQRYAASRRNVSPRWIPSLGSIFICGDWLFRASAGHRRYGFLVAMFGWMVVSVMMLVMMFLQWRERVRVPENDDVNSILAFYKAQLERIRSLLGWPFGIAMSCMVVGLAIEHWSIGWTVGIAFLWVAGSAGMVWVRLNEARRLERLNVLLDGDHRGGVRDADF